MKESDVKLARYSQVEKETDAWGRVIGVRRLKPSEQSRIAAMTSDLSGSDEAFDDKGEKILVPRRAPLVIVASVCLIHDENGPTPVSFPANRRELDAMFDRLDVEGLEAAAIAAGRLAEADRIKEDPEADGKTDAKN